MRIISYLFVFLTAALLYFAVPLTSDGKAFAQQQQTTTTETPNTLEVPAPSQVRLQIFGKWFTVGEPSLQRTMKCSEKPNSKGGVFLGKIMPCLTDSIKDTTAKFSAQLIVLFQPLFYFFLIFVVTMFGIKVLQGEREIGIHAFVLVLKICFAIGIFQLIPTLFVPAAYDIISEGVTISVDALEPTSFGQLCSKDIGKYGDANTPKIWMQMDCVLGKLFGFAAGTEKNADGTPKVNMVLASSVAGLLSGFFFGGTLGVALFFAMIGTLWSIMSMVLKVALAFVNGYLIVCVLLIISPLFLPLMFLKVTSDYFERWWRAILGGLMMPIIVACYSVLALIMYDSLLFKDNSLMQTLFSKVKIEKALQHSTSPCDFNVTNDPAFKGIPGGNDLDTLVKSPFLQNFAQPLLSGGSNLCGMLGATSFKITNVDGKAFKQGDEAYRKLFIEAIELFIMAWLISEGMRIVQDNINSFTGSRSASTAITAKTQAESGVEQYIGNLKNKISGNFADDKGGNGVKGAEFIGRFGSFLGSSVRKKD